MFVAFNSSFEDIEDIEVIVEEYLLVLIFVETMSVIDLTFDSSEDDSSVFEKQKIIPFSDSVPLFFRDLI